MQEAVAAVGGGAAGVVTHPDGEDGILAGGHGHAGAGRDLQHDQAEAGGDGVGEAAEGGFLAVAAQQFGVLGVAGGQQLGLESERDEARRVGGVRRGHGVGGPGRSRCRVGLAPRGVLGVGLAHGCGSSAMRYGWWSRGRGPGRRRGAAGAAESGRRARRGVRAAFGRRRGGGRTGGGRADSGDSGDAGGAHAASVRSAVIAAESRSAVPTIRSAPPNSGSSSSAPSSTANRSRSSPWR